MVTGKGGVGKTTVSAVLARSLARRGRRVLVLEVDPRESLHSAFGAAPSGGEIVRVDARLSFQNLQPRTVIDELVRERLKVGILVRRTLDSQIYRHFVEGAPGLKELAILGHAQRTLQKDRADTVVLDAPATGHGLSLLAAPGLVSEVIVQGPVGALARELAEFVADARACRVVVVTRPEEMPVEEALELGEELRKRGHQPALLAVNGLLPAPGRHEPNDRATELWRARHLVQVRELEHLERGWPDSGAAAVRLPQVALPLGPPLIDELRRVCDEALAGMAAAPWE